MEDKLFDLADKMRNGEDVSDELNDILDQQQKQKSEKQEQQQQQEDDELQDLLNQAQEQADKDSQSDNQQNQQDSSQESTADDDLDKIQKKRQEEDKKDKEDKSQGEDNTQDTPQEDPQKDGHDDTPNSQQLNDEESWIKLIGKIGLRTESVQAIEPMRHDVPFDFFELHPKIVFGAYIASDNELANGFARTVFDDNSPLFPPLLVEQYLEKVGKVDLMDYLLRITKVYACSGIQNIPIRRVEDVTSRDEAMHEAKMLFVSRLYDLVEQYDNWPDVYTTTISELPFFEDAIYKGKNQDVLDFYASVTYRELLLNSLRTLVWFLKDMGRKWNTWATKKVTWDFQVNGETRNYEILAYYDFKDAIAVNLTNIGGGALTRDDVLALWENTIPSVFGRLITPFVQAMVSLWLEGFDLVANNIAKRGLNLSVEKAWLKTWSQMMADYDESRLHLTHEIDLFANTSYEGTINKAIINNPMAWQRKDEALNSWNTVFDFGIVDGCTGAFLPFISTRDSLSEQVQPSDFFNGYTYPALYCVHKWMQNLIKQDGITERDKDFATWLLVVTKQTLEAVQFRNYYHSAVMNARREFWNITGSSVQLDIKQSDVDILVAAQKVIQQATGIKNAELDMEIERLQKQLDLMKGGNALKSQRQDDAMPEEITRDTFEEAMQFCLEFYYNTPSLSGTPVTFQGVLNYNNNPIGFYVTIHEVLSVNRANLLVSPLIRDLQFSGASRGAFYNTEYNYLNKTQTAKTIVDFVVEKMYDDTGKPDMFRKEVDRVPSVTVYHPLYTFATTPALSKSGGWNKLSATNLAQDLGLSPTLITGVGQGRVFVGKTSVQRNADSERWTKNLQTFGLSSFLIVMGLASRLMSKTGFRSTVRPRPRGLDNRGWQNSAKQYFDSGRYEECFLPQNYNRMVEEDKLRPISDEFEKVVLMYLKEFPELYGLIMKFADKEYTMLTFKTKIRSGRSFIPIKKP